MARRLLDYVFGAALALPLACISPAVAAGPATFLDQGWSKELRELFYFTAQGSRLIPYDWFVALEIADGDLLFSATPQLAKYGFIPADGPHPLNPGQLPIGFAIDPAGQAFRAQYQTPSAVPSDARPTRQFLGLTCAACHTSNVTVEGRTVRIEGGAAHLDFDRFYADLAAAVTRTFFDPAKFQRFALRVLGTGPSPSAIAELRLQLADFESKIAGEAVIRRPQLHSGFGRVDALTQIVNALAATDQGDASNVRAVVAPTSYPTLWLTPHLEFVQWNPIAGNPIGRNGGEVLGVFGTATLTGEPKNWFSSSLLIKQLHALETWIADLQPPKWDPAIFGAVRTPLVDRGRELFTQYCVGCHNAPPYRRTDPDANHFKKTFIEIGRVDYRAVGTDPVYSEALLQRLVRTNAATARLHEGQPQIVSGAAYFVKTAGAVVSRAMDEAGLTPAEKVALAGFRLRPAKPGSEPQPYEPERVTDLKASPLAGIWTSGPYLHNGSVPTVYELLSPVAERRPVFWTGGTELDREKLGFMSGDAPGRFRFDTSLPGNRNTGHLYPARGLDHDQRMAIIEYLKTQ